MCIVEVLHALCGMEIDLKMKHNKLCLFLLSGVTACSPSGKQAHFKLGFIQLKCHEEPNLTPRKNRNHWNIVSENACVCCWDTGYL